MKESLFVQSRKLTKAEATQASVELWESFSDNEKACVKFGMLPASKMQDQKYDHIEGRLLAVAVFDRARADGGMIA